MNQPVHLEVFYPYPPERVWHVLTDRRALAAWMMENDFEPTLGHKFQFYHDTLPDLKTTIRCEVIELEAPTRLVYTWQESPTAQPSLVVWTLTTVIGGTQLRLKHYQSSYTTAIATPQHAGLYHSEPLPHAGLAMVSPHFIEPHKTRSFTLSTATLISPLLQRFNWDYYLNQRFSERLGQQELTQN